MFLKNSLQNNPPIPPFIKGWLRGGFVIARSPESIRDDVAISFLKTSEINNIVCYFKQIWNQH
jgi:hypothetical protein